MMKNIGPVKGSDLPNMLECRRKFRRHEPKTPQRKEKNDYKILKVCTLLKFYG